MVLLYYIYYALLDGVPGSSEGEISLPLFPDYNNRPLQMVNYEKGKGAVTQYKILSVRDCGSKKYAFVELSPLTGRTHQLRVHCAHKMGLDTPIVGDALYGKPDKRLMLHAARLEFMHPFTGTLVSLYSAVDF